MKDFKEIKKVIEEKELSEILELFDCYDKEFLLLGEDYVGSRSMGRYPNSDNDSYIVKNSVASLLIEKGLTFDKNPELLNLKPLGLIETIGEIMFDNGVSLEENMDYEYSQNIFNKKYLENPNLYNPSIDYVNKHNSKFFPFKLLEYNKGDKGVFGNIEFSNNFIIENHDISFPIADILLEKGYDFTNPEILILPSYKNLDVRFIGTLLANRGDIISDEILLLVKSEPCRKEIISAMAEKSGYYVKDERLLRMTGVTEDYAKKGIDFKNEKGYLDIIEERLNYGTLTQYKTALCVLNENSPDFNITNDFILGNINLLNSLYSYTTTLENNNYRNNRYNKQNNPVEKITHKITTLDKIFEELNQNKSKSIPQIEILENVNASILSKNIVYYHNKEHFKDCFFDILKNDKIFNNLSIYAKKELIKDNINKIIEDKELNVQVLKSNSFIEVLKELDKEESKSLLKCLHKDIKSLTSVPSIISTMCILNSSLNEVFNAEIELKHLMEKMDNNSLSLILNTDPDSSDTLMNVLKNDNLLNVVNVNYPKQNFLEMFARTENKFLMETNNIEHLSKIGHILINKGRTKFPQDFLKSKNADGFTYESLISKKNNQWKQEICPSGKYKGKTIGEIFDNHFDYCKYAFEKNINFITSVIPKDDFDKKIDSLNSSEWKKIELPFGKFKGKSLGELVENNTPYIKWAIEKEVDFVVKNLPNSVIEDIQKNNKNNYKKE